MLFIVSASALPASCHPVVPPKLIVDISTTNPSRKPHKALYLAFKVLPRPFQSIVSIALRSPPDANSPIDFQCVVSTKVLIAPIPVLIASPSVLPTLSSRPVVSKNPLIKVAVTFAILFARSLIGSQSMESSASRSFVPTILPMSVKSDFVQASFTRSAKLDTAPGISFFVKSIGSSVPEPFPEPLPLPEPLLAALFRSSENFSISSNPINSRFSSSVLSFSLSVASLAASPADAVPFKLSR